MEPAFTLSVSHIPVFLALQSGEPLGGSAVGAALIFVEHSALDDPLLVRHLGEGRGGQELF